MKSPYLRTQFHRPWLAVTALVGLLMFLLPLGWWQGVATGPQVQVPMFYDAHYLFPRPWTQSQSAPGVPEQARVALYGRNYLTQSFIAGADQLGMVRLWLAGSPGTVVTVSLYDDDIVYTGNVVLSAAEGDFYVLSFPPFSDSAGRYFSLTLTAPTATDDQPLLVRTVGGDRLGASVRLNELPLPGNLALATYGRGLPGSWWVQGLIAQLLPPTFQLRLQQYKPWKGSAFLILLLILAVLTFIFFLLIRPNGRPLLKATAWMIVLLTGTFLLWQVGSGRLLLWPQHHRLTASAEPLPLAQPLLTDPRLVDDLGLTLWTARREPEPRFVGYTTWNGYPALRVPADSQLIFDRLLMPNGRLRAGVVAGEGGRVQYEVRWRDEILVAGEATDVPTWLDVDLSLFGGQPGRLTLATNATSDSSSGLWLRPQLLAVTDWLYAELPETAVAVDYRLNEAVELAGYEVQPNGDLWRVTLYWRALASQNDYATVFVHALDSNQQILAQSDGPSVYGSYPLPVWLPDVLVADVHIMPASSAVHLGVGLYDPVTFINWSVMSFDGEAVSNGRILLPVEPIP